MRVRREGSANKTNVAFNSRNTIMYTRYEEITTWSAAKDSGCLKDNVPMKRRVQN